MSKKIYMSPIILSGGLNPGDDPSIVFGDSKGTSGNQSMFTFDGIDDDTLTLIDANCDDLDLQDMDANGDYVITLAEFNAWYDANQPW